MLKYLIIDASRVDGTLGAYLQHARLPVSFLVHGKTLKAFKKKGFTLVKDSGGETLSPVVAFDETSYSEAPDAVFLALKPYSIEGILPFLERITTEHTAIIPPCSVFGMGERLQKKLKKPLATDGCIYVVGDVGEAGRIRQLGNLMRVVYGVQKPEEARPILEEVKTELMRTGVEVMPSDNIHRDCTKKFAYLSPHGVVGTYFYITMAYPQRGGEHRNFYRDLMHEVLAIAEKMGIVMDGYSEADNLKVVDGLVPEMTALFQKDVTDMKKSEVDGLVYEMQRLSAAYGVLTPCYDEVIEVLRSRGME